MAPVAQQIAEMIDMLPEQEQALAFELVKRMVLAWDSDFTKTTPAEQDAIDRATAELAAGEYVTADAINWS